MVIEMVMDYNNGLMEINKLEILQQEE